MPFAQPPPLFNGAVQRVVCDSDDAQDDLAVVHQNPRAGPELIRSEGVRDGHSAGGAGDRPAGQEKVLAGGDGHRLVTGQLAGSDLRPLQVGEDPDGPAQFALQTPQRSDQTRELVGLAVGKIIADNVDAESEHRSQHVRGRQGGPVGGHDLGLLQLGR